MRTIPLRTSLMVAARGLVLLALPLPGGAQEALSKNSAQLENWKFALSVAGLCGAATAFIIGLLQYRRTQQWKRAEFLANEMKDLATDLKASNALTMIDWAARRIRLHAIENKDDNERTLVTYAMQCQALQPHTFIGPSTGAGRSERGDTDSGSDSESTSTEDSATNPASDPAPKDSIDGQLRRYSPDEALIRDCYDALLDRLDRLGGYLDAGLMSAADMEPYIGYYIDDIAASTSDPVQALWSICFLTYVHFYHFSGVPILFKAFGHNISPDGPIFTAFLAAVPAEPRPLAKRLQAAARKEHAKVSVSTSTESRRT